MGKRPRHLFYPGDKRASPRATTHRPAVLHVEGEQVPVTITDLSPGGAGLSLRPRDQKATRFTEAQIEVPGLARLPVRLCRHGELKLGAAFTIPAPRKQALKTQIDRLLPRH